MTSELRYIGALDEAYIPFRSTAVDAYWALDMRLDWKLNKALTFSLIGRNLLEGTHREFAGEAVTLYLRNDVERSVFAQMRWNF